MLIKDFTNFSSYLSSHHTDLLLDATGYGRAYPRRRQCSDGNCHLQAVQL